MTSKQVRIATQPGTIIGETAGKRGRVLLTVQMDDGRTIKIDSRSIDPEIRFAAPIGATEFFAPLPSADEALRQKIINR